MMKYFLHIPFHVKEGERSGAGMTAEYRPFSFFFKTCLRISPISVFGASSEDDASGYTLNRFRKRFARICQ